MDIKKLVSKCISERGLYELPTFFLNVSVLLLVLRGKKPSEIAEELGIKKTVVSSRANTATHMVWRYFETQEKQDAWYKIYQVSDDVGSPYHVSFLMPEKERWMVVCYELVNQLNSINITADKADFTDHRNIDLMEMFLGNLSNETSTWNWFNRGKKMIETFQKRIFYYVIMGTSEEQIKYFNSQGDGDWYYDIFKNNMYAIKRDDNLKIIADAWLKEYELYKKRKGYTHDVFNKLNKFYLNAAKTFKIYEPFPNIVTTNDVYGGDSISHYIPMVHLRYSNKSSFKEEFNTILNFIEAVKESNNNGEEIELSIALPLSTMFDTSLFTNIDLSIDIKHKPHFDKIKASLLKSIKEINDINFIQE